MLQHLESLLGRVTADYADLRFEEVDETSITVTSGRVMAANVTTKRGYVLRVLRQGGWAEVQFTAESDFDWAVGQALAAADVVARHRARSFRMAPVPAVRATLPRRVQEDPARVSLAEKIALVQEYGQLCGGHPKIARTQLSYFEQARTRRFVNSEGSAIEEPIVLNRISGVVNARDGSLVQNASAVVGGGQGFQVLRGRHEEFERLRGLAVDLLAAEPMTGGTWDCVLDNRLTGTFTHEAFGHYSEADIIEDLPELRQRLSIGARLGSDILNVVSDSTGSDHVGHYVYDDEGVRVRRVPLIRNGILAGRLHSRRTAAEFGDEPTGHAVAEDYRYCPIVRMGTVFVEPGTTPVEELFERLGNGVYLCGSRGGQTAGENFTFGAQHGYRIRNGRKEELVRDLNISGNLFHTLMNIEAVGNDFLLSEFGGCGKGQTNFRSNHGGPHMLVRNLIVGGRS